jgi:hypothetical protein
MFENEIKFISDFCLNKINNLGSFVTFEKLSATDLHPAVITYISAELDYMIYRDRKKLLKDSIFDYSGREIADHFNVIATEIKGNKKISSEDIKKLIVQAVSFNINYVVRPKWSVTKLIYNDQEFISVEELERMLDYLYYYDYIKNVLSAYTSRRKLIQLTLTEFDLILNKIDRELFKSNTEELINNALHSIADFFNIGGIDKNRTSLLAVEIFLKEKNLMDHLLKLRQVIPNGSRKKYEIEDIKKVLYAEAPVEPESISGYEAGGLEIADETAVVDIEPENIEVEDYQKETAVQQDQGEFKESEIVTEEKIKSSSGIDEQIPDEPNVETIREDVVDSKDELIEFEEEVVAEIDSENALEDEFIGIIGEEITTEEKPSEIVQVQLDEEVTVEDDEIKIVEEEGTAEEDELLSFYEQELATMDDESSDLIEVQEDMPQAEEKDVTDSNTEMENSEEVIEDEKEQIEVLDEQSEPEEEETSDEDELDLSIFEDAQDFKEMEEVFDKVSENFDKEFSEGTGASENLTEEISEISDEQDVEPEIEINEEQDNTDEASSQKKIIDEMLDDYFGEEKDSSQDQTTDAFDNDEVKIQEDPESIDDLKTTTLSSDDNLIEESDNGLDEESVSVTIEDNSLEDDISNLMNDIDDMIETNDLDEPIEDEDKIEPVEAEKLTDDEELQFDEEIYSEEDSSIEESSLEGKLENPLPKSNVPIREKDLFSYLSKKEVKKIVTNVFSGDDEDFVTTTEKISECVTYKEATEILKGVFFTYRVSPYSKEAVVLTNAVSHFFRQI